MSAFLLLLQGVEMPFAAFMATLARPHDKSVVMGLWGTFFGVGYALLALVAGSLWGIMGIMGISIAICVLGLIAAGRAYRAARMSAEGGVILFYVPAVFYIGAGQAA